MAINIEDSLGKSIRDYLQSWDEKAEKVIITVDGGEVEVDNIQLVWEGSEYYMVYEEASTTGVTKIRNLDNCLPITIIPTATTS